LLCGASVSHDVKCFSVGQRVMSVPISASSRRALYGPMPSICDRSAPVSWCSGVRRSKRGSFFLTRLRTTARWRQWRQRGGRRRGEPSELGFDRGVARRELPLVRIEELQILLQDEDVFGAVVAHQRGHDLGRRRAAVRIAMLREALGVTLAGDNVAEDP
jgi:hypothetical protein